MSEEKQYCPICGTEVMVYPRYPDYVCETCEKKTTDKDGNAITFYNETLSGHGCMGFYDETEKKYNSNECYIEGVKCYAEEAHLGGIVIQPVPNDS